MASYDGRVFLYPLWKPLYPDESVQLTEYLVAQIGKQYDTEEAILSAGIIPVPNDDKKFFCSKYVSAALSAIHRAYIPDPSSVNPKAMIRLTPPQNLM